ncbi:hypothetical protein BC828DRAFT_392764 [Blastocladiella britannica]|nr:hypothetical protein BC828DRAFT_392764 [Blastocladiella britannica]
MARFNTPSLLVALVSVSLLLLASSADAQCSGNRRVRKEFNDLSQAEVKSLQDGIRAIYTTGKIKPFVDMHIQLASEAHNTPQFLLWHRVMVYNYETLLLQNAPGLQGLPYFDATYSYSDPGSSFIFRDDVLGSANPAGGCLGAPFQDIKDPNGQCVQRQGQRGFTLYSPQLLLSTLQNSPDYVAAERAIEMGPHAGTHNFINGNMGNVLFSPTDPIFWHHHGAVDYWWAQYQGLNNNANMNLYGGVHKGKEVSMSDMFDKYQASQVLDYYNTFCYSYQQPRNAPQGKVPFAKGSTDATPVPVPGSNSTTPPTTQPLISIPSNLTDDFIKNFNLNATLAGKARELMLLFVGRLNDRISKGEKLPTLADLASFQKAATPASDSIATATPTHSGASSVASSVLGAIVAVLALAVGMQ